MCERDYKIETRERVGFGGDTCIVPILDREGEMQGTEIKTKREMQGAEMKTK